MDNTTRKIISEKYFSIDDAINSKVPESKSVFIIGNERKKKNGEIGRYYTVFPSFSDFIELRDKFPHSHEHLIDHVNNKPNHAGRLIFDFDIKDIESIPDDFEKQITKTICKVIETHFVNVNSDLFCYVWSTSPNDKKFSKHLTVKNLYFDNWLIMSKIFYKLFSAEWKYKWIWAKNLIDFQVVKKNSSLRMVGSSKIGGNILTLDSDKYEFTDSLIRVYFKKDRDAEQLVTIDNVVNKDSLKEMFANYEFDEDNFKANNSISIIRNLVQVEPIYSKDVYKSAFNLFNKLQPGIFEMGKIYGNRLNLMRLKENMCLLDKYRCHEKQNAVIIINADSSVYFILFGCYQKCKRPTEIGTLTITNLVECINENFEHLTKPKKTCKKKSRRISF